MRQEIIFKKIYSLPRHLHWDRQNCTKFVMTFPIVSSNILAAPAKGGLHIKTHTSF